MTSSSWSSPWPTTSPPASASRRTTFEMTGCRRPVHRVGVVTLFAGVDVEAALEEQVDDRRDARQTPRREAECARTGCCAPAACPDTCRGAPRACRRRHSCAASNSWPSIVVESTCDLSARQLENPYCLARSNCASASFAAGFAFRSSSRRRLACLRSQSRLGASGSDNVPGADCGVWSDIGHLPSFEKAKALSWRPSSAAWARNEGYVRTVGWVEPFTRTVGRPRGTGRIVSRGLNGGNSMTTYHT